uniref:Uncharacterized protein n=1 Tax=Tanacetum cinerariifolium TaxID=118510 RepID=A0A6L2JS73_TANCI|nr:hypothetical protein [Tanacetum cinerariifolium]
MLKMTQVWRKNMSKDCAAEAAKIAEADKIVEASLEMEVGEEFRDEGYVNKVESDHKIGPRGNKERPESETDNEDTNTNDNVERLRIDARTEKK